MRGWEIKVDCLMGGMTEGSRQGGEIMKPFRERKERRRENHTHTKPSRFQNKRSAG